MPRKDLIICSDKYRLERLADILDVEESEAEKLLHQIDHEAGLEILLDDFRSEMLQCPGSAGAAGDDVHHDGGVQAGLFGQLDSLAAGDHVDGTEQLIDCFAGLAGAGRADVDNV